MAKFNTITISCHQYHTK